MKTLFAAFLIVAPLTLGAGFALTEHPSPAPAPVHSVPVHNQVSGGHIVV